MKRFVSRYAKVHHWRQQQEDACRSEAARVRMERDLLEKKRDEICRRQDRLEEAGRQAMNAGLFGAMMMAMTTELDSVHQQLAVATSELLIADRQLVEVMARHQETRKELKIIEELVHRERLEHNQQLLKAEEMQNQERALQTFYRNQAVEKKAEDNQPVGNEFAGHLDLQLESGT